MNKSLSDFNLTMEEVKEYEELKTTIFGKRYSPIRALFVVLDDNNEQHKRYSFLTAKMMPLFAYLVRRGKL